MPIEIQKTSQQKLSDHSSTGDSSSTISSGEHLNDLCLSPTDIFDIEQPGAGKIVCIIYRTEHVNSEILIIDDESRYTILLTY